MPAIVPSTSPTTSCSTPPRADRPAGNAAAPVFAAPPSGFSLPAVIATGPARAGSTGHFTRSQLDQDVAEAVEAARAPGGTTQVASYSSTMQGPACGVVEVAAVDDRRLEPAGRRAEIGAAARHGDRTSGARLAAAGAAARGCVGDAAADHFEARSARPAPRPRRGGRRCARAPGRRLPRARRARPASSRPVGQRHAAVRRIWPW